MAELDDLFDYLQPRGTIKCELPGVFVRSTKPLTLVMKHAGDSNPEYVSMSARIAAESDAQAATIRLFAQTVIEGWENCIGADGSLIAYTPDLGVQYLTAIAVRTKIEIASAFERSRDARNFRGSPAAAAAALGK